jgi:hypothetical protein
MMTFAGTLSGSLADTDTSAPLVGAAAESVTVALIGFPPTTVEALNETDATIVPAVTVSSDDCLLVPLSDAVIVTVPGATAAICMAPVEARAGIVTAAGTVATAGLLLDRETLTPPIDAAAPRVIVPCTVAPATTLVAFKVTLDKVPPDDEPVGVVSEVEPQAALPNPATISTQHTANASRGRWMIMGAPGCRCESDPSDFARQADAVPIRRGPSELLTDLVSRFDRDARLPVPPA